MEIQEITHVDILHTEGIHRGAFVAFVAHWILVNLQNIRSLKSVLQKKKKL